MTNKIKKNGFLPYVLIFLLMVSCSNGIMTLNPNKVYAEGELEVINSKTDEELVNKILGEGVKVSNITKKGNESAFGIFSGGSSIVGFEKGIILSTGKAEDVIGPNKCDDKSTSHGISGDVDLTALAGMDTHDAAILEFDFVPIGDHISFQYVFSSEEYNEFVYDYFNDIFAFFVNGVNVALVPGTEIPVSIDTVNGGNPLGTGAKNSEYFINNDDGGGNINIEMDGLTTVMSVSVEVNPGEENHIKLAIADGGDSFYDSNVFVKAGSLNDREAEPGTVKFDSRQENDITLVRVDGSDGTVSVNWSTKDENDVVIENGAVTFGDGEIEKVITISEDTYKIELSNPTGGLNIEIDSEWKYLDDIPNLDTIKPNMPLINRNPDKDFYNDNYTISLTSGEDIDSGVKKTVYKIVYGETHSSWYTYLQPFIISQEGTTAIYAKTIDNAGNESDISSTFVTINKNINTYLTIQTYPDSNYSSDDYTVTLITEYKDGQVQDAVYSTVYYKLDNGDYMIYKNPFVITKKGQTVISAEITDIFGNKEEATKTVYILTRPDEDGDGIPNDEDKYPTDPKKSGYDEDGDGIDNLVDPDYLINEDKEALEIIFTGSDTAETVTTDITLPTEGANGSKITWQSSLEDIISNSGKIVNLPNKNTIVTLTANLSNGDVVETKVFTVTVYVDGISPEITLFGDELVNIEQGQKYIEEGYKAIDNLNGDITDSVIITGHVNTDIPGTYLLKYIATDLSGNKCEATRTIVVNEKEDPKRPIIEAGNEEKIADDKIEDAVQGAKQNNQEEIKIKVQEEVTTENNVKISISKEQINNTKNNDVDIIFETDNTSIKIPVSAVDTSTMGTNTRLEIVCEQVDTSNEENRDMVDAVKNENEAMQIYKNKVFDFKMKLVEEDEEGNPLNEKEIEDFTSEEDIVLRIVVGEIQGETALMAYYYNPSTGEWEYVRGKYEDGIMEVLTNHLSIYSIMTLTPEQKREELTKLINDLGITKEEVINIIEDEDMDFNEMEKYNSFEQDQKYETAEYIIDKRPDEGYENYNALKAEFDDTVREIYGKINNDTHAPIITLNGPSIVKLLKGQTYTEQGATAVDNIQGDISEKIIIIGEVNTSTIGEYVLTYQVKDSSDNIAEITRKVIVYRLNKDNDKDEKEISNKYEEIEIIEGEDSIDLVEILLEDIAPKDKEMNVISKAYNINIDDKQDTKATIVIRYDEGEVINEDHIGVFIYDEGKDQWKYIGGVVDKENNEVTFDATIEGKIVLIEYNKTFKDIEGHWAQDIIESLASKQIIEGDENGCYKPNVGITRAEFASIITKTLGLEIGSSETGFLDINNDDWYAPYVAAARNAGLVNGVNEVEYQPNRIINRQEMTAMVMRAYKNQGKLNTIERKTNEVLKFKDNEIIDNWAKNDVYTARYLNLIEGRNDNYFEPKSETLKAEAAALIYRFLNALK